MSDVNGRKSDGSTVEGSTGNIFANYRKRFRKEAENLSHLSHPNIVQVFDVFDENNTTYYAMRYIDGESLDAYIGRKGQLSEQEAIAITTEIGQALEYMHSGRMLHLDIKPNNIMRDPEGRHHLIDFGLSKQFAANGEPETSTTIGLGTPGYAPIEQSTYKGDGSFPASLDIYALGATMYKMLSGQRPPIASTILNDGFPDVALSAKGVSPQLIVLLSKAMEPRPKYRFQSMKQFLNELDALRSSYADYQRTDTNVEVVYGGPIPPYKRTDTRIDVVYGGPIPRNFDEPKPEPATNNPKNPVWISILTVFIITGLITCMIIEWSDKLSYGDSVYYYWLTNCIIITIFAGLGIIRTDLLKKFKWVWFGLFIPSLLNPFIWDPNWYWEWIAEIAIFAPLIIFSSKINDKILKLIMVLFIIFASLMIFGF